MSRRSNCWDDAVAGAFFATLKNEVYRRPWSSRLELCDALFGDIEVFCSRRRLDSTLGYTTPAGTERAHFASAA